MAGVTLLLAFLAGMLSFLSPCVLPLVPGFLAYLGGAASNRREVFLNSVFFVLGFAIVFSALGILLNTLLSGASFATQEWLARIGGVFIIAFGLNLTGLLEIPYLQREHKFRAKKFSSRYLTSLVFGAAFAAGWTPCVGAVLGGILGLAVAQPASALPLLLAYSLGLGVPFLAAGLLAQKAVGWMGKHASFFKHASFVFGVLLIIIGILVFTRQINRLANLELLNKFLLSN